jgi:hypothetical protein
MPRRKGELSPAAIDRDYPFQVALPADRVSGKNHEVVMAACLALGAAPRQHTVRRENKYYVVFAFATDTDARAFKAAFGGETFDSKERGRGKRWFEWRTRR